MAGPPRQRDGTKKAAHQGFEIAAGKEGGQARSDRQM